MILVIYLVLSSVVSAAFTTLFFFVYMCYRLLKIGPVSTNCEL